MSPCLRVAGVAAAAAVVFALVPAATADADTCADIATGAPLPVEVGACADVLAQEMRWLAAITGGDVATVEQILGPTFTHINADGRILDRAAEIASMSPLPFTMNPSEQQVDIHGDTAVIHGINTLIQDGEVMARERFTDVFVLQNGSWRALAAQETEM